MLILVVLPLLLAGLTVASDLPPLDTLWINSMLRNPQVERVSVRDSAGTHVAILTFADGTVETIRFQGPHWPVVMAKNTPSPEYLTEGFESVIDSVRYSAPERVSSDTTWMESFNARLQFLERVRFTWQLATLLRAYRDSCWADSTLDCSYYMHVDSKRVAFPCESSSDYMGMFYYQKPTYTWTHRPPTFEGFMEFIEHQAAQASMALAEEK